MTASQEVLFMQLLQKIAEQGNHQAMDQLTLEVLKKISERLEIVVDMLMMLNGRMVEKSLEEGKAGVGLIPAAHSEVRS